MKMELILSKVCLNYGYSVPEVMDANRAHLGNVKTCVYCALRMAGFSTTQIAKFLKKDHSTVAYVSRNASQYELAEATRALKELGLPVYRMSLQSQKMAKMTRAERSEYKQPFEGYRLDPIKVPNYKTHKTDNSWRVSNVSKKTK